MILRTNENQKCRQWTLDFVKMLLGSFSCASSEAKQWEQSASHHYRLCCQAWMSTCAYTLQLWLTWSAFFARQLTENNNGVLDLSESGSKFDARWMQAILLQLVQDMLFCSMSSKSGKLQTHGLRKCDVTFCLQNKVLSYRNIQTQVIDGAVGQMISTHKGLYLPVSNTLVSQGLIGPKGSALYKQKAKGDHGILSEHIVSHTWQVFVASYYVTTGWALLYCVSI